MKEYRFRFWKRGKLIRDKDKCKECGLCVKRCPHKALKIKDDGWKLTGICMRCGRCVRECPAGALEIVKNTL